MSHVELPPHPAPTALLNPKWWEWNERVWGVQAKTFRIVRDGSAIEGAYYVGHRGKILTPPLNPHTPLSQHYSNPGVYRRDKESRIWVELADALAETFQSSGLASHVVLPTGFLDARPFLWTGHRVGLSFTYIVDLPRAEELANRSIWKNIRKAWSRGFRAERSDDWAGILGCLQATETRKGFQHRLDLGSLRLGEKLMGPDCFRGYVVRDQHGHVVSGGIRLHGSGRQAIDWVQGSVRWALADGVNQLMYDYVMTDLQESGAVSLDLAGANIREVAVAKSSWGYPLVPQLSISPTGMLREFRAVVARSSTARSVVHRLADTKREWFRRHQTGGKPRNDGDGSG